MFAVYGLLTVIWISSKAVSLDTGHDLPTVQAVIGYQATIPCNLSTPLADDAASLILWYRLDTPNPIYTLDVRNTDLQSARHFPSGGAKGRTYFDVSVHPPVLVLDNVELGDKGEYKCRVDLKRSRTLILLSKLDVIVPPGEPIIMDEHGQRLKGIIGPYDEGTSLLLSCEVDGGDPSPNVTWWRDEMVIDDDFNSTQGFVRNSLLVRHIRRSDLMAEFICKASNTEVGKPREAVVRLDINLLPLEVKIKTIHFPVLAGLLQEIRCESLGSRPRAFLSWWIEEEKLETGIFEKFQRGGNYTLSTLQWTPRPEDHGKRLICKALNPVFPETAIKTEIVLQVQSIPVVSLKFSDDSNHTTVKEGDNLQLDCLIRSDPTLLELAWHFDDVPINERPISGVLIRNQTIVIERAARQHRGRYRCYATNAIGRGSSNYAQLDVMFSPVCKSPAAVTFGIENNEPSRISCEVEAVPDVLLFRWVLNSSLGQVILRDWSKETYENSIEYTPEVDTDFGIMLCWSRNNVGIQKEPCIFNLVPAGIPDSPYDCHILNETTHSLSVDCKPGFDRGLKQAFYMELYDAVHRDIIANLTNIHKPSFKATGLSPNLSYVVAVYAANAKGRSNTLVLVSSTSSALGIRDGTATLLSTLPLIVVLVGVVIVLLIALFVVVFFVKTRSLCDEDRKHSSFGDAKNECDFEKKDGDDCNDTNEKGPDIIQHSKESEVFFMDSILEDIHCAECLSKEESPPTELIRQKYMSTVL